MKTFHSLRGWLTVLAMLIAGMAQALNIYVNSPADAGTGSLRDAVATGIAAANSGQVVFIYLNVPGNVITLNSPIQVSGFNSNAIGFTIETQSGAQMQRIESSASFTSGTMLEFDSDYGIMGCQNVWFNNTLATSGVNGVSVEGTAQFVMLNTNFTALRYAIHSKATRSLRVEYCGFSNMLNRGIYHHPAGATNVVGPIDILIDHCIFSGGDKGVDLLTLGQASLTENYDVTNNEVCAERGVHIQNYGLAMNKNVNVSNNIFDCDDAMGMDYNLRLSGPLQHWDVLGNEFHQRYAGSAIGIWVDKYWEAGVPTQVHHGISFVAAGNNLNRVADNGTNQFFQYVNGDYWNFRVDDTWHDDTGVEIIGYDLTAGVYVEDGPHTTIRDNTISPYNRADLPISLDGGGNTEIDKIEFTSAVQQGANTVIGYKLPTTISNTNGRFVVDFYEADANGGLIKYLDSDHHISITPGASYTHTITVPVNSNNRLAATLTSRGNVSPNQPLGTSEVEYFCYQPEFTVGPGCLGDPIQFTSNLPAISGYPRYWTFDDPNSGTANTSSQAHPTHVFVGNGTNTPQTFTVTLTVYGPFCGSFSATETITLNGYPEPTFVTTSACSPDPWQFNVTGTGGGLPVTYLWNFGDPNSGANNNDVNPNTSHVFVGNGNNTPQTFPVTLAATNSCGTGTASQTVTASWPPVANFTADEACIGEITEFTNLSQFTGAGTQFLWNFGDPNSGGFNLSTATNPSHEYVGAPGATYTQIFTVTLTVTNPNCPSKVFTMDVEICPPTCCNSQLPVHGIDESQLSGLGQFYLDYNTGMFGFESLVCPDEYPLDCFTSAPKEHGLEHALDASAAVLTEEWLEDPDAYFDRERLYPLSTTEQAIYANANDFELGVRGNFRVKRAYAYRVPIDQLPGQTVNRNRGTFDLDLFRWENDGDFNDPNKWVLQTETTVYDANGNPVADENVLEVPTTSKFGYNNTLPVLVAQNAEDHTVEFRSFENLNPLTDALDDGMPFDMVNGTHSPIQSHTGDFAVQLHTYNPGDAFRIGEVVNSEQVLTGGLLVRSWVWVDKNAADPDTELKLFMKEEGNSTWSGNVATMSKVASAGEWALYEGIIPSSFIAGQIQIGTILQFGINLDMSAYSAGEVYIDDVRIQPMESEMVCYVYDHAQRLTHVFDDQHFAAGFQYNAEGLLVRKLKETERGWKTISESHSNSVGSDRF